MACQSGPHTYTVGRIVGSGVGAWDGLAVGADVGRWEGACAVKEKERKRMGRVRPLKLHHHARRWSSQALTGVGVRVGLCDGETVGIRVGDAVGVVSTRTTLPGELPVP